jgi:hypothetical protein
MRKDAKSVLFFINSGAGLTCAFMLRRSVTSSHHPALWVAAQDAPIDLMSERTGCEVVTPGFKV